MLNALDRVVSKPAKVHVCIVFISKVTENYSIVSAMTREFKVLWGLIEGRS